MRTYAPQIDLAPGCLPYLRQRVGEMLVAAQERLPQGHTFRAGTMLRTHKMQADMYWSNYNKLKAEHPDWPASTLRRQTNRFFAAPDVKAPPGHCTGGAVDVAIIGPDGIALDMVAPTHRWKGAPTFSPYIGEQARAHRIVLIEALAPVGFSNCRDEWWHWSYGDSAWAVRVGEKAAPYGLIEPPEGYTSPAKTAM
jgi:D-alanyl-D-alanine dipeptidase